MTAVTINRTTSTLAPTLAIIIPLDTLGEMSSADELGSRVCKPLIVVLEGQIFDVDPGLNLSGTESKKYFVTFFMLNTIQNRSEDKVAITLWDACHRGRITLAILPIILSI